MTTDRASLRWTAEGGVMGTRVMLPTDVNRIDETGYVWGFLDHSTTPDAVAPGAIIVSGDDEDPVVAEVVDIVE